MKRCGRIFCLLLLFTTPLVADAPSQERRLSKEDMEKISEAFGHLIGQSLDNPGIAFDLDRVIQGIRDSVQGKAPPLTEAEYEEILALIQEQAFYEIADTNLAEAGRFMKANLKDPDVKEAEPSLVQYKVILEGRGREVRAHACPLIHYTGSYLDGTVFGSSAEGDAVPIPLDQTISGFAKGIVGMKEGEKRRIFVHPDMGYGISGNLPPNSLLTFDVELVLADAYLAHLQEDPGARSCPVPLPAGGTAALPPPSIGPFAREIKR